MKYTQEQQKIIDSEENQLRIIAGPGTGKSTVIVGRIVKLLKTNISPENIFVFCFAKHDKNNILSRLNSYVDYSTYSRISINNYHGFGLNVIREHGLFGKQGSEIKLLEESESFTLIRKELFSVFIKNNNNLALAEQAFKVAKKSGIVDLVFKILNHVRDEYCVSLKSLDRVIITNDMIRVYIEKELKNFIDTVDKTDEAKSLGIHLSHFLSLRDLINISKFYSDYCEQYGYIDFMDMILQAYLIIRDSESVRSYFFEKVEHLLVDEFQDISPLQFELVTLLTSKHNRIFAVGDVDQCVYQWRNARPRFMKDELPKKYKELVSLPLSINFRSDAHIVDAVNSLIKNNKERLDFSLRPFHEKNNPVVLYKSSTILDQATDIANRVESILINKDNFYSEKDHKIAIIVRSTRNVSTNLIRNALFKRQIPVQLRFESKIVERIMSIICSICNLTVDTKSPSDFLNVISIIPGFGEKTVDSIRNELSENASLDFNLLSLNLKLKGSKLETVKLFMSYILDLNKEYQKTNEITISDLNFFKRAFPLESILKDSFTQGKGATENTAMIDATIEEIKNSNEELRVYRDTLTAGLKTINKADSASRKPAVLLCTAHHAKGGEWEHVICPDFVFGGGGFPAGKDKASEEERRIAYVACSRAKQKLYLYYYLLDIEKKPILSSPYLRELGLDIRSNIIGSSYKSNFLIRKNSYYKK